MYANRTMKKKKFEKEKSKVTYDNNNGRAKEINMNCKDAHECKNRICKFSHPWEYDWVDQQAVEQAKPKKKKGPEFNKNNNLKRR